MMSLRLMTCSSADWTSNCWEDGYMLNSTATCFLEPWCWTAATCARGSHTSSLCAEFWKKLLVNICIMEMLSGISTRNPLIQRCYQNCCVIELESTINMLDDCYFDLVDTLVVSNEHALNHPSNLQRHLVN